jgi:hypothetical protein
MTTPDAGGDGGAVGRSVARFRVAIGLATLAMLGLSWPLWVDTADFPRVPFVAGLPAPTGRASWLAFVLLLVAVGLATAGIRWRAMLGLSVALLVGLILGDQHRFQPWVYQYAMAALALATVSGARALGLARLFLVALYFHSALSKLDVSFVREMGRLFLDTALGPAVRAWPEGARTALILLMPAAEGAIALGLCFRRTRRAALAGAIGMHATLLGILGVWGLRHSPIVQLWNVALIVEDVTLFGAIPPAMAGESGGDTRLAPLTTWAFVLAATLPFGERLGLIDAWPAFALYASHTERTEVYLNPRAIDHLPESVRRHWGGTESPDPWGRLDLTGWSREVRGVPVYPAGRACNGLAEALAARYGAPDGVRVVQWGRADARTGRRTHAEATGREAIRRLGDRYRLNAHPARDSAWGMQPDRWNGRARPLGP